MRYIIALLLFLPFLASAQGEIEPSPEVKELVAEIGGKGIVYGKFVGYAGSTPPEFLAFEKFVAKASLEEMKFYLKSEDPSIRAYAFWAIAIKHKKVAYSLVKEMDSDNANINMMLGGCLIIIGTVDSFRTEILEAPMNDFFVSKKNKSKKSSTKHLKY